MKLQRLLLRAALPTAALCLRTLCTTLVAAAADPRASVGSPALAAYFRAETEALEAACLADLATPGAWQAQAAERRRQLADMLGLDPMPERTPLAATVTGRLEHPEFTVEKLHFQSLPGLYVTANLYLPRGAANPVPAILYVCGHAQVKTNGVSCGNKTAYQHHGIWFARNGHACLVIDTVQLGEIEGLHHGTYREGMWWWNARGYTPAGVEAWNGIRALDYLESRPEVDRTRLGMTGRSGGGSYTWTVAALDERVRAAAPVAGITDLRDQVIDGCVEGHCDCMFFVNTHRWDFPLVAALVAPRPLLIVNTDDDSIFPLDGVVRLHAKTREVYAALGQPANLGLVIGPGGHNDTQDLQVPVMRWFNRHLKGADPLVETAAARLFDPLELRAFATPPTNALNSRIHETWGRVAPPDAGPPDLETLRARSFGGWPEAAPAPRPRVLSDQTRDGWRWRAWAFESQPQVPLRVFMVEPAVGAPAATRCRVLDAADWAAWQPWLARQFDAALVSGAGAGTLEDSGAAEVVPEAALATAKSERLRLVWFAPRGVGPSAWTADARKEVQIRRRFMLLGQTLDGMRVWDIRRAVQVLVQVNGGAAGLTLEARGVMGVNALYASLYEPAVRRLELPALPASHREGPDYLNVLQVADIPAAIRRAEAGGVEVRR